MPPATGPRSTRTTSSPARAAYDYDRYAERCAWLVANGCDGVVPNGSLGEHQVLTPEKRARVAETAVAAIGGARVMPGVAAYGSAEARRWAEQAAEAGCGAVILLPPNAYRADERVVVTHFTIRLDTPAGLVVAEVAVEGGAATSVTLQNVPSFAVELDREAKLPGGRKVRYDLAYGGNFYAILPLEEFGLPFDRARKDDILAAGLSLMEAINAEAEPVHPEDPSIRGCHHVHLYAPGATAVRSRHAMAIHPGWFDRSPCGTGTSARMAQPHARGELPLHTEFVNESFIGTTFTGRLLGTTEVAGRPAVLPSFTGRAWITGTAQYLLGPTDPFPAGFVL
ncbi:dihydrodipicolinate synthase family protein [Streptomyces sp. NPDC050263]|uniref:dihydrodipicolinate synthase family protein n=1 Tax=Streptomyces sp. NPDC050263 TaxID=3155037 RepID=UPI00341497E2